jgi:hypothetical protein
VLDLDSKSKYSENLHRSRTRQLTSSAVYALLVAITFQRSSDSAGPSEISEALSCDEDEADEREARWFGTYACRTAMLLLRSFVIT